MKVPRENKTLHERLFSAQAFKQDVHKRLLQLSKSGFAAITTEPFVGTFGYPSVRFGLLSRPDSLIDYGSHSNDIQGFLHNRLSLVNANNTLHVKLPSMRLSEKVKQAGQQAAMSVKALDTEVQLIEQARFQLRSNDIAPPHGPQAQLRSITVLSNAKVPRIIQRVVADTDLCASTALKDLWSKGFDEQRLSSLLSTASLGTRFDRRLVPTRWSITAVDDIVAKNLHKKILDFPHADFQFFHGGYLGNMFVIIFIPNYWGFELFENTTKDEQLSTDYHDFEGAKGRTSYASRTAGGYYAARLAVLEHLERNRLQAGVLVLRFITPDYWAPLGVWVVREAVRQALQTKPISCSGLSELIKQANELVKAEYGKDLSVLLSCSVVLSEKRSQSKLQNFF